MVGRWVAAAVSVGCCALAACGSSGGQNQANPGAAGAGASSAATAGVGASGGSAGAESGGSAGSGGSGRGGAEGLNLDASCHERTTNQIAGTRLKHRTLVTAEGDRVYSGFYDALTGIDCYPLLGKDGKQRCYPEPISFSEELYSDSTCSDSVYRIDESCTKVDYFTVSTTAADACSPSVSIFGKGEAYAATLGLYSRDASGVCSATQADEGVSYVRKGVELEPSDFVEVTPQELAGPSRVQRVVSVSDDGAVIVRGYRDSLLEAECSFSTMQDGSEVCLPGNYLPMSGFADDGCSGALLAVRTSCGASATPQASVYSSEACRPGWLSLKAGARYSGQVYTGYPTACMPLLEPSADVAYYVPEERPSSELMQVTSSVLESDPGRLKPIYRSSSDGGCWFQDWWDSELEVTCGFGLEGGTYRCVPEESYSGVGSLISAFSDAGCTQTLELYRVPTCLAQLAPKILLERDYTAPDCARPIKTLRRTGQSHTAAELPLWQGSPASCTPVLTQDVSYFEVGPMLGLDALMAATLEP